MLAADKNGVSPATLISLLLLTVLASSTSAAAVVTSVSAGCDFPGVGDNTQPVASCETSREVTFSTADGNRTLTSSSTGSADLLTGQLKGVSNVQTYVDTVGLYRGNGAATSTSLAEEITITGLTGTETVTVTMIVDGSFTGVGSNQANAQLWDFGGNQSQVDITWNGLAATVDTSTSNSLGGNWAVDVVSDEPELVEAVLSLAFEVSPSDPTFSFRALLQTAALGNQAAQETNGLGSGTTGFGQTAQLGITLSDELGWESASGLFLTQVPDGQSPVPATLALLGLGLAGIGYQRRKQIKAA